MNECYHCMNNHFLTIKRWLFMDGKQFFKEWNMKQILVTPMYDPPPPTAINCNNGCRWMHCSQADFKTVA